MEGTVEQNNKILSIAIPTYNVEKYINQCLSSFVVTDIMDDIEVLVIDDGSPDSSKKIAMDYVKRFPQTFKVISKKNGGHGSAVNRGIAEAKGKYFKVVDGDDWVDGSALKELVFFLRKSDCDVIATNYLQFFSDSEKTKIEYIKPNKKLHYKKEYLFDDICQNLYVKMHSMTIKTEILRSNNIRLDENCFYVDMEYITYPIPFIRTIIFLNLCVYNYRTALSEQSVNILNMQKRVNDHLKVVMSLLGFYADICKGKFGNIGAKRKYIENMVNRAIASQYKIYLSFVPSSIHKQELITFDKSIIDKNLNLYQSQSNVVVKILKLTNFITYKPFSLIVRMLYVKQ